MLKSFKRMAFIVVALCLSFGVSFAGTAVVDLEDNVKLGYRYLDIAVTGDGSETVVDLSECVNSEGETKSYVRKVKGFYIYRTSTTPGSGAATPAAYSLTVTDEDSELVYYSVPVRSTTDPEWYAGHLTVTGQYELIVGNLVVTVTSDIQTGDTTHIRLILGKWRD